MKKFKKLLFFLIVFSASYTCCQQDESIRSQKFFTPKYRLEESLAKIRGQLEPLFMPRNTQVLHVNTDCENYEQEFVVIENLPKLKPHSQQIIPSEKLQDFKHRVVCDQMNAIVRVDNIKMALQLQNAKSKQNSCLSSMFGCFVTKKIHPSLTGDNN